MPAFPFSSRRFAAAKAAVSLLLVIWAGALAPAAEAEGDVLYGAILMATAEENPTPIPPELKTQAANLEEVFGYNQYRILGQKKKTVTIGTEDWVVPSRKFFLHVDTKSPVPSGYALGLQLLRDDKVIVSADVKLSRERPLYIRGPFVGEGQLIILLMVL